MIITRGDLFTSNCQCLVNTVNCEGIMGGGIALAFKNKFPWYYQEYRDMCRLGLMAPGHVALHTSEDYKPDIIISFPTKDRVSRPSKTEYIVDGLVSLRAAIEQANISSIAIPALGCGLGGLKWENVLPLIVRELNDVPNCDVNIFEPCD